MSSLDGMHYIAARVEARQTASLLPPNPKISKISKKQAKANAAAALAASQSTSNAAQYDNASYDNASMMTSSSSTSTIALLKERLHWNSKRDGK